MSLPCNISAAPVSNLTVPLTDALAIQWISQTPDTHTSPSGPSWRTYTITHGNGTTMIHVCCLVAQFIRPISHATIAGVSGGRDVASKRAASTSPETPPRTARRMAHVGSACGIIYASFMPEYVALSHAERPAAAVS